MASKLRSLKKAARKLRVPKGIFKKAGAKLKAAKSLPNKGARVVPARAATSGHTFVKRPRNIPANAAPFRPELASQVPPHGLNGPKTTGVIDLGGERVISPQVSGQGPGTANPVGMGNVLNSHVEAHTLARMREAGVKEATLYINKAPCSFTSGGSSRPDGCLVMLEKALRPGEKITVYYPPGQVKVFVGK